MDAKREDSDLSLSRRNCLPVVIDRRARIIGTGPKSLTQGMSACPRMIRYVWCTGETELLCLSRVEVSKYGCGLKVRHNSAIIK